MQLQTMATYYFEFKKTCQEALNAAFLSMV